MFGARVGRSKGVRRKTKKIRVSSRGIGGVLRERRRKREEGR